MALFTFNIPGAQPGSASSVDIKGPPGLTLQQAREIFEQQLNTGAFVGVSPGTTISAATQAAQGLKSAASQLGQLASGTVGALGAGVAGAAGQIGSLVNSGLAGATNSLKSLASSVSTGIGSTALTNPINITDVAKTLPAVGSIANLSESQVTSALSTAKNLAGQGASILTNTGVGEFAFNAQQLEAAGVVKPGTSALISAGNSLSSVLKSPAVYTGKDGISSISGLLESPMAQSTIQQNLMNDGLQQVSRLAGDVSKLPSQVTAGLSLASATLAGQTGALSKLAQGAIGELPDPNKILAELKDAVYAVNLEISKIPGSFKETTVPTAVVGSVNRETLNAATSRVLGSEKIPKPSYAPSLSTLNTAIKSATATLESDIGSLKAIKEAAALRLKDAVADLSGVTAPIDAVFVVGPGPDPNDPRDTRNPFVAGPVDPGRYIMGPYGPIYVAPGNEPPGATFVEFVVGGVTFGNATPSVPAPVEPVKPPLTPQELAAARAETRELLKKYDLDAVVSDGTPGDRTAAVRTIDGKNFWLLPNGELVPL